MEIVRLDTWSQVVITIIAVAQVVILATVIGVVAYVVKKMRTIASETVDEVLEKTLPKIQPALENVSDMTAKINDLVEKVGPRVVQIADSSENAVHSVSEKVKTTSSLITENVARPMVNIASLLTGVQKGLEVWKSAHDGRGSGSRGANGKEVAAQQEDGVVTEAPPR